MKVSAQPEQPTTNSREDQTDTNHLLVFTLGEEGEHNADDTPETGDNDERDNWCHLGGGGLTDV